MSTEEPGSAPTRTRRRAGRVESATRKQLKAWLDQGHAADDVNALASYEARALIVARLLDTAGDTGNAGEVVRLSKTLDDLLRRFEPREAKRDPVPGPPDPPPGAPGGHRDPVGDPLGDALGAGPEVGNSSVA